MSYLVASLRAGFDGQIVVVVVGGGGVVVGERKQPFGGIVEGVVDFGL